jgi:glycosyltransferase involved in cell wall biosynthesis
MVASDIVRVVFFEPYPMGLGGNFLTQKLILERLDQKRFHPIVIAPMEGIALDVFREMGIECVVVEPPERIGRYGGVVLRTGILGKLKATVDLIKYNLQLASLLRRHHADVVYANCVRAVLCIGFAARLTRLPLLLYVKGELNNPIIDWLSFKLAHKILFFCEENRDDRYPGLVRKHREKIEILEIGLEPKVINNVELSDKTMLKEELAIDPTYINVGILGQLYRPKGQHIALEALSKLVVDCPNVRLYLLGDHVIEEYRSYKEELDLLVSKYGLDRHVVFTGWRKDALEVVALMDIMIHPSFSEGFGRAVLEAMALGKPVIASKVGGLRNAIRDGINGYLIDTGDVDALAQRWRKLTVDAELRQKLGQEAKRTVFAKYLIDDKVARLSEIWCNLLQGKC